MARIADLFAARLAELEQKHQESEAKLNAMIASVRGTIAELEAIDFPED